MMRSGLSNGTVSMTVRKASSMTLTRCFTSDHASIVKSNFDKFSMMGINFLLCPALMYVLASYALWCSIIDGAISILKSRHWACAL